MGSGMRKMRRRQKYWFCRTKGKELFLSLLFKCDDSGYSLTD